MGRKKKRKNRALTEDRNLYSIEEENTEDDERTAIADEPEDFPEVEDLDHDEGEDPSIELDGTMDDDRKKRKLNKQQIGILIGAGCVFLFAVGMLIQSHISEQKAQEEYEKIQTVEVKKEPALKPVSKPHWLEQRETEPVEVLPFSSFEELEKMNPDIVAWISQEDIGIEYPVTQTDNDEYYLNHTFQKESNQAGCIFMEYRNTSDFSDKNTILYGHNMKNQTMFGYLKNYKEKEYYEEHPEIVIYTPEGKGVYEIFSCGEVSASGFVYNRFVKEDDKYAKYVKQLKAESLYDTGVEVSKEDQVLILSTCTKTGADYRMIVAARLKEFKEKEY